MICYKCDKIINCPHIHYIFQNDISIDKCKYFSLADSFKYLKIAKNEDLMLLIYNYFTNNEELYSLYSKEEIEDMIKGVILNL